MSRIGPRVLAVSLTALMAMFSPQRHALYSDEPGPPPIRFEDVSAECGVQFEHFSGRSGKHFIIETVTAGLATLDYDNDGLLDIYLLNGAPIGNGGLVDIHALNGDGSHDVLGEPPPQNRLFRNLGGFRFIDVTEQAGTGDLGFALGVVAGDYDNDGDQDLFISNYGPTVLLDNQGDGTFSRRLFSAPSKARVGAGIALLDIERDGNLDLYVANYVDFNFDRDVTRTIFGVPAAPGPKDYDPDPDSLYRNTGTGGFEDISHTSGIASVAGSGMGVVALDYDEDRDSDIFVCNDSAANFLYENQGDGTFLESALLAGVAYDVTGSHQASMGVDLGDFDQDGHIDLVTTNFMDEIPTLHKNSGLGYFDDSGPALGLGVADRSVTWGVALADLDNDTWPDLFIAAGHLLERVSKINDSEQFEAPNLALRNDRGVRFIDQTFASQASVGVPKVSRGIALDDLNNDGHLDVVVLNLNDRAQVLRNVTDSPAGFLRLRLVGTDSARDPAGARVTVHVDELQLVQEKALGRGYQSHFGSLLHFGLGEAPPSLTIDILWPSGQRQSFENVQPGAGYVVVEGASKIYLD